MGIIRALYNLISCSSDIFFLLTQIVYIFLKAMVARLFRRSMSLAVSRRLPNFLVSFQLSDVLEMVENSVLDSLTVRFHFDSVSAMMSWLLSASVKWPKMTSTSSA